MEQWWQQRLQLAVVHRLQTHQHHVALRHVIRRLIGAYIRQMKRAIAGVYLQAVLFHILIIAVQQEMYFLSCMSQFSSIKTSNGTSADDSVSHIDKYIQKCGSKGTIFLWYFIIFC